MAINNWVIINKDKVSRNGILVTEYENLTPEQLYDSLQCNYPKFFKMDKLCKWAAVAAECLFSNNGLLYKGIDRNRIAVALTTSHGCIDVDKRYYETIAVPSPALFVYTLPNIMLGEICIRHGFKGEQVCMVNEKFDANELYFTVNEFLTKSNMEACLCGWVDVAGGQPDICLFWVTKTWKGVNFSPQALQELCAAKR